MYHTDVAIKNLLVIFFISQIPKFTYIIKSTKAYFLSSPYFFFPLIFIRHSVDLGQHYSPDTLCVYSRVHANFWVRGPHKILENMAIIQRAFPELELNKFDQIRQLLRKRLHSYFSALGAILHPSPNYLPVRSSILQMSLA